MRPSALVRRPRSQKDRVGYNHPEHQRGRIRASIKLDPHHREEQWVPKTPPAILWHKDVAYRLVEIATNSMGDAVAHYEEA